ncbi:hypothetical protein TNCV_5060671 [Trichonephila clavipes]|nr:hypothetical protein TNCV_5060671 [Trichonephila clavipes]
MSDPLSAAQHIGDKSFSLRRLFASDETMSQIQTSKHQKITRAYGLSTIFGLPLHDEKGRYRPEKSMTDSQKDLSQLVAIYFVVLQCNPWPSLFR